MGLEQVGGREGGGIGQEVPEQVIQCLGGHSEYIHVKEKRALGGFLIEGRCDLTGVNRTCLVTMEKCVVARWDRHH